MWNRKRKVYKYYISKMVFAGREKNRDPRCGPDIVDIYKRCDSECSKEVYERYPHEKVSCMSACYYRPEDTYTYCKYEGEEIVSPQESYDMVKDLLLLPIEKIKVSSKNDIKWAIKAIDVLVETKNRDIWRLENQTDKYTSEYINSKSSSILDSINKLNNDKRKLENILDNLSNRKQMKLDKKKQEEEMIENLLDGAIIKCDCGANMIYTYNKHYCGMCGKEVESSWKAFAKKLAKENKKNIA